MNICNPLSCALALSILIGCQILMTAGHTSRHACEEPVSVAAMYQNLKTTAIEAFEIPQIENNDHLMTSQYYDVIITALNKTCHHGHRGHLRSCNCGTRDELNFDANRIPKLIPQTSCCGSNQFFPSRWVTECRDVYQSVRVLRRSGCVAGVYQYLLQWERIPVGCSCHVLARPFAAP